jgi:hypothetical protein
MKAFCIEAGSQVKFEYDLTRRCGLPGINCPECGEIWAQTGNIYPSVNDPRVAAAISKYPDVVSVDEFRKLSGQLRGYLSGRPCYPGLELGPLHGRRLRNRKSVTWANAWTILFDESIIQTSRAAGVDLNCTKTILETTEMFEIEAYQNVKLNITNEVRRCRECGRNPISVPKNLILNKNSFASSMAVQRVADLPTVLIVNEKMQDILSGIAEITLTEVDLI